MAGRDDLMEKLSGWQAAGLITAEQAAAIRAHEGGPVALDRPRSSVLAEVLGYLGGSLALVAALVLAGQYWGDVGTAGRLIALGTTTALVALAALLVGRGGSGPIVRLSDFLFVLATVGLGFFVGLLATDGLGMSGDAGVLLGTVAAAAASATLWSLRQGTIRHLALFGALAAVILSGLGQFDDLEGEYLGLALWALGVAWGLLAWGDVLPPRSVGLALGSAGALLGSLIFSSWDGGAALVFGLAVAGGLVTEGAVLNAPWVLGLGTLGMFVFVPRIIFDLFGDAAGGAFALLLSGLALLALAVGINRLGRRVLRRSRDAAPPARPRRARRSVAVVAAAATILVTAGYVVAVGYMPPPDFPPVSGVVPGTVAFHRWEDGSACIYTVPASGGAEHLVGCDPTYGQPLAWTAAGELAILVYGDTEARVSVVDPANGTVITEASGVAAERAVYDSFEQRTLRADGTRVEGSGESGTATILVRSSTGAMRTIVTVEGPRDYGFWEVQWSPDGAWILALDGKSRLILVSADGASGPFLLADRAGSPAWFMPGVATYAVDLP